MPILFSLALLVIGPVCFGQTAPGPDEFELDDARQASLDRITADRKFRAFLHARAHVLAQSPALRTMMAMPNLVPPVTLRYFLTHPPMPIAHVFVPLMGLAELEFELADRLGLGVTLVQNEVDYLLALAEMSLHKPQVTTLRQIFEARQPVLEPEFADQFLRELKEIEVESPDSAVVLPPLFGNLVGHVRRGLKMALRLSRNHPEATNVYLSLQPGRLKRLDPRQLRIPIDEGHTETPAPFAAQTPVVPNCSKTLDTSPSEQSIGPSLQSFPDR